MILYNRINYCSYILDLADDMYSFIGMNAVQLLENGQVPQLPYDVLLQLVSSDYYIDLSEEMLLSMLVEWVNHDFKVRIIILSM